MSLPCPDKEPQGEIPHVMRMVSILVAGQEGALPAAESKRLRSEMSASRPVHTVVVGDLSPPMQPRRAEAFLPWKLPGASSPSPQVYVPLSASDTLLCILCSCESTFPHWFMFQSTAGAQRSTSTCTGWQAENVGQLSCILVAPWSGVRVDGTRRLSGRVADA